MIASLMMYQRPELNDAHKAFWTAIRSQLKQVSIDSPPTLSQHTNEFDVWQHPELVLSQTCGMPYRCWLHDKVTLAGTPDYGIEGCDAGYYHSVIVVNKNDSRSAAEEFKTAVFAYNQIFSQSGFAAAYEYFKQFDFWFTQLYQTGSHRLSALSVANGTSDIAAIDAMTWKLLCRYESWTSELQIFAKTCATPGLPLITSQKHDGKLVYQSVASALMQISDTHREQLGIKALVAIEKEHYLAIPNPPIVNSMNIVR